MRCARWAPRSSSTANAWAVCRAASASATSGTRPSSPGRRKLHGADITVPDLRGGFSHLIAALAAEGTSRVRGVDLIDRGYEHFQTKLDALGAIYERD